MSKQSVTRSDLAQVLIATDVLSRGIDVPAVTLALSPGVLRQWYRKRNSLPVCRGGELRTSHELQQLRTA